MFKLTDRNYNSALASGKYCKTYRPGTITRAGPATLGLMLFEEYDQAIKFYNFLNTAYHIEKFMIIKKPFKVLAVEGIGIKTIPKDISLSSSENYIDYFYLHRGNLQIVINPPGGTVCYPEVRVLYQEGPSLGI